MMRRTGLIERITVVELLPSGRLVKHKGIAWRKNKKPGRKPRKAQP